MIDWNSPTSLMTVFENLEKTRVALFASHQAFADLLGFTATEYEEIYLRRSPNFPISALITLSGVLGLVPESFYIPNVLDTKILVEHLKGNSKALPERYTVAAFSKLRTIANFLDYAGNVRGWQFKTYAMKQLQITKESLSDLDGNVNIHLATDLLSFYRKNGFTKTQFTLIGAHSISFTKGTAFGNTLSIQKSPRAVYEEMIAHTDFYERNCSYKIKKLKGPICIVESETKPEAAELLKEKHLGSKDSCLVRAGILTSAPGFMGLPYAHVREVQCVFDGAAACRFEINFDVAQHVLKTRRKDQAASRTVLTGNFSPISTLAFQMPRKVSASFKA